MRVVPFMPRDSTTSDDIDAVEVRRISSQDFRNGYLLPKDVAEGASELDSEPVKVSPDVLARYELRCGDIVMPRMLGRYGASNLLVVGIDDAKQHLVASHNTTAIRPAIPTMTDEERMVYAEMVAAYLTDGHGSIVLQVLSDNQYSHAIRPSDLFEIEVPQNGFRRGSKPPLLQHHAASWRSPWLKTTAQRSALYARGAVYAPRQAPRNIESGRGISSPSFPRNGYSARSDVLAPGFEVVMPRMLGRYGASRPAGRHR